MLDEKDGDRKGAYVNIQTNTDSKVNLETVFEKIMNYQNKSLEIVVEGSSSHANRKNMHCVESLFKAFYEWKSKTRVTSLNRQVMSSNARLRVQIHELRVQIHEL